MDKCSEISQAMDRLMSAARDADHAAKETVTVKTSDLLEIWIEKTERSEP